MVHNLAVLVVLLLLRLQATVQVIAGMTKMDDLVADLMSLVCDLIVGLFVVLAGVS